MATFEMTNFIKQPSFEKIDNYPKDDLIIFAQHYEILVSRGLLKKVVKACLLAGLIEKGVLPDAELTEQEEPSAAVIESLVGPVAPLDARKVRSSLSMPKF